MKKSKSLLKFLLIFAVSYAVLLVAANFMDTYYANSYRWFGKVFFENYGEKGFLQFFPVEEKTTYRLSTKVVIFNKDQIQVARQTGQATVKGAEFFVSSWYNGLLPDILLLSLIIASPVPWKRKLFAALVGLILFDLFILLKWKLAIAWEISQNPWLELPTKNPDLVKTGYEIFVRNIETTIILPVLIWVVVTFRKKDFNRLRKN